MAFSEIQESLGNANSYHFRALMALLLFKRRKKLDYKKTSYLKRKEKHIQSAIIWSKNNPEKRALIRKKWRDKNIEKARAIERTSRQKYRHKKNDRQRLYRSINPGKEAAYCAKRRSQQKNATPSWLSISQLKEIEQFYIEAKELQWLSLERLEVDHIVPLQGVNVCGLHVPWNLQILPKIQNCKKNNKYVHNK